MQGRLGYLERLVPNTTAIPFKNALPATKDAGFVAPNSNIVGNVTIADSASVWFGSSIRGDNGTVSVGEGSSIGDRSVVSNSTIGAGVNVGPNAFIEGAKVGDDVRIGANSIVGKDVTIGARSFLEEGSVVVEGTTVPTGHVFAGNPAVSVRETTTADIENHRTQTTEGIELATAYAFEVSKSYQDLLDEEEEKGFQERLDSNHWRDTNYQRINSRQGSILDQRATN
jgi:carbonic anhydrase/acetyltransferase-like protein (isoleucine patch superfamily)